ncbi:phosphotransferase [Demequina sp. NBRC 110056]|uniref:phosphotransferase n=1 Tax=Demequina sp. NBRC 110056 TaxID=1570345 RepID=UPI000A018193|nr:phosphotransferase [Demequina sp. NBRC 110056]
MLATDGDRPFYISDEMARSLIDEQFPQLAGVELGRRYTLEDQFAIRIGDDYGAIFPRTADKDGEYARVTELVAAQSPHWTFPASLPISRGVPGHGFPYHWTLVRWISASSSAFVPLHGSSVERLGAAIREIHRPAPRRAPVNPVTGVGLEAMRPEFELMLDFAVRKGAPENRVIDEDLVQAAFATGAAEPIDAAPTWTHGRLEPRAVMSDRGDFAGILLWHNFGAGDPAGDLGFAATMVPIDARDEFWRGYGTITPSTATRALAYELWAALKYIHVDDPFLLRIAWERLIELELAHEA